MPCLAFALIILFSLPVHAFEIYSGVPFYDAKNTPITLESFAGKPVLLFVWKEKCAGCRAMLPEIDKFYQTQSNNIKVVPVMIDKPSLTVARKIYTDADIRHLPIYLDTSGNFTEKLNVTGTPTIIIYNKTGDVVFQTKGFLALSDNDIQNKIATVTQK